MTLEVYNKKPSTDEFLKIHGLETATLIFLAGDASPRKYVRLQQNNSTVILMDTPATENPEQFIEVASLLINQDFSAPQILASDLDKGLVLLEDLQDQTFSRLLAETPGKAVDLYPVAVETLISLARAFHSQPNSVDPYSQEQFMAGIMLFVDWFYPASHGHPLTDEAKASFEALWTKLFDRIDHLPKTLILRDFHVDNLIYLEDRPGIKSCGLLDFQDARWGPMVYDFVSLIDDVRIDISPKVETTCWDKYSEAFPLFKEGTPERTTAHMLSVSRLIRILGTFTRLAKRDGKTHYLNHMPRIWRLIDKNLNHPDMGALLQWFNEHVSSRTILND